MRIHASVVIQRPIGVVFDYLSTPSHLPCWVAGVATADGLAADRQEVGATFVVQRTGLARATWEVTAYQPPRSLALRGLDDAIGVEVRWTLEGIPSAATRVRVEADLRAVGFLPPSPMDLAEMGTRQIHDDLKSLRHRLEDDTGAAVG